MTRVEADVLVVGGGLAGALAALAAADRGARVALVRRAPGATALSSGAIGVAPDVEATPREPLAARRPPLEAARRLAERRPGHPYAVVGDGLAALPDALAFTARALSGVLAPPLPRARWIAGPYGAAVECALCQRAAVAGDLAAAPGPFAICGLRGHLGWDAALVAHGLARLAAAGAPPARAVELDFPLDDLAAARPHELARAIDAPGGAERLGEAIRRALPPGAAVALVPPILGLDPAARAVERAAAAAGLPLAETLADVPSVPGLRLDAALSRALAAAGVRVLQGAIEPGSRPGDVARAGEHELLAPRWVLATGRFVGGGIARRGALVETVLGLPVLASEAGAAGFHLARRPAASLTARARATAQPLLAAGLHVDAALRPLAADGRPVHEGLHAAGAVIGGHEHAADGTGLGVAILTGWLAGRAAAAGAARTSAAGA